LLAVWTLHELVGREGDSTEIGCHFEDEDKVIVGLVHHVHRLLLLPGNLKDPLLLSIFIGAKLIDDVFLPLQKADSIDLELELFVGLQDLVSKVDMDQKIRNLHFRKQVVKESSLELGVGKTHVLLDLDGDAVLTVICAHSPSLSSRLSSSLSAKPSGFQSWPYRIKKRITEEPRLSYVSDYNVNSLMTLFDKKII
jgi:hypothetical protein